MSDFHSWHQNHIKFCNNHLQSQGSAAQKYTGTVIKYQEMLSC